MVYIHSRTRPYRIPQPCTNSHLKEPCYRPPNPSHTQYNPAADHPIPFSYPQPKPCFQPQQTCTNQHPQPTEPCNTQTLTKPTTNSTPPQTCPTLPIALTIGTLQQTTPTLSIPITKQNPPNSKTPSKLTSHNQQNIAPIYPNPP